VFTIIVFQAITGLLVGFVMKYADAVLKGFATSVAVVLATILSFNDNVNLLYSCYFECSNLHEESTGLVRGRSSKRISRHRKMKYWMI
jgi:hypothetical protein